MNAPKRKCECVTTSANNPDDNREFADPNCKLCDGDGWQKRTAPSCSDCGAEQLCSHRGCFSPECDNFCAGCWKVRNMEGRAEYEAAREEQEHHEQRAQEERTRHDYFGF